MVDYIHLPGDVVPPPPYRHTGATMHGLLFDADPGALQALVDGTLNRVPGMKFEAVSATFLFIALYVDSATTIAPGYANRGSAPETDIGFWVLVRGGRIGTAPKLRWFPLYLFVDTGAAMAIGREVYGYPKLMGAPRRIAPNDPDDPRMELVADYFDRYDPTSRPVHRPLFAIAGDAGPAASDTDGARLTGLIAATLAALVPDYPLLGLPYLKMPMVFVKQFRAVDDAHAAAFQAVTAIAVVPTAIRRARLIAGDYRLDFADSANIRFAADLGIVSGQAARLAFSIEQDFEVGLGSTL